MEEFDPTIEKLSKEDLSEDVKKLAQEFFHTGKHMKVEGEYTFRRAKAGVNVAINKDVMYVPCN